MVITAYHAPQSSVIRPIVRKQRAKKRFFCSLSSVDAFSKRY